MATDVEPVIEDAGHVFLLMGREYRISRSIRVQWFFQHFNSVVEPKAHNELLSSAEELEVLSVLPSDPSTSLTLGKRSKYRLVPNTHITFIGRRYRFVFCLDISPSLANVDIQSATVINDEVFEKFKNTLTGLVQPFGVPGNDLVLTPELFITVVAYTSILNPETPQVLIQGCLVTKENLHSVLELIHEQLVNLEDVLAKQTACCFVGETQSQESSKAESDTESEAGSDQVTLLSPEAGPMSMLRNALLAFQLLPDNASAGAVVLTDGVFALPDASALDSLLAQLRASTVCCSFLKLGSAFHAHGSLGYIPHCDMMQFIAKATSGAYLAKTPPVDSNCSRENGIPEMNLYHKAFFCWRFQRDYDLSKIDSWMGDAVDVDSDLQWPRSGSRSMSSALSEWEKNALPPPMRKRQLDTKLQTSIRSVLSVRLREGYAIQDISFTKGGKQLEVRLTLPWKQHVHIDYLATAAWPSSNTMNTTNVLVTVEGPYEFLHDVTYHSKQPFTSGYRMRVIQRFKHAMKSLQSTDELLVHLQSFDSNSVYYTIPESARKGVPLFHLPRNSNVPVLSLQHTRKISKSQESQFAVFWKPVLSLDTTVWQRWMHCHRIGLVLEHDVPLPKDLHLPIAGGRFNVVQCRMALSSLHSLLRQWSSFVLLENHSYIKFIDHDDPKKPPLYFCLLRITSRPPCLVIRLAFLGGTPGYIRHSIVKSLREELYTITAPLGQVSRQLKSPQHIKRKGKKTVQRLAQEKPCVIMLSKPLDKILIKYDKVPVNMHSPYPDLGTITGYRTNTGVYAARANENHMKVLSHYLYHHRWIWTVQDDGCMSPNPDVVSRILATLTRLRLHEGYNFACSNAGIITLARELRMKDHTNERDQEYSCIVQYVLFPAFTGQTHDAVEEWAFEGKTSLANNSPKVQLVTEAWVEPQFGVFSELSLSLKYLEGLAYYSVPDAMFPKDLKYITGLLTFDHLWRMCDDQMIHTPENTLKFVPGTSAPSFTLDKNWIVDELPFACDVVQLLHEARQVEMLFSSLIEGSERSQVKCSEPPNEALCNLLIENMEKLNDREVQLTDEDCRRFISQVVGRDRDGIALPFSEDLEFEKDFSVRLERHNQPQSGKRKHLIRWRCFVRSVASVGGCGRLILSFIPASLRYLHCMKHCKRSSPVSTRDELHQRQDKPEARDNDDMMKPSLRTNLTCSEEQIHMAEGDGSPDVKSVLESENIRVKNVSFHDNQKDLTPTSDNLPFWRPCEPSGEEGLSRAFIIPIYAYDVPLSSLTTIRESEEENGDERAQGDVIQDFTQISATQYLSSSSLLDNIPRSLEGNTYGRFGSSKHLALHCNAIHDLFSHSFVLCIFSSLQGGQNVDNRDMQSAVDEICEENFVEIDITDFIRTLCGHYAKRWGNRDLAKNSLPFPDGNAFGDNKSYLRQESSRKMTELLSGVCESVSGLHQSVTSKFAAIMSRYFKRVPANSDFFFYSPQVTENNRKMVSDNFDDIEFIDEEKVDDKEIGDAESDVFSDDDVIALTEDAGVFNQKYDSDLEDSDSENETGDNDLGDEDQLQSPLFLHLTCSLKDRTSQGTSVTAISVKSLPLCVGEIFKELQESDNDLNPFSPSLRITLDLICLTLPPEPDYSSLKSVSRPCQAQSDCYSTCSSNFSQSPPDKPASFDLRRSDSKTTSHDIEGMRSSEPLQNLPGYQRAAMLTSCDQIQWLLQDEIVAELRHTGAVTLPTLEKVAAHVQEFSHPTSCSCILRHVSLQFVFGAEKSMELFVKEFEKIEIEDYHLKILSPYYYLVLQKREIEVPHFTSSPEQNSPFDDTLTTEEQNGSTEQEMPPTENAEETISEQQPDKKQNFASVEVDEETGESLGIQDPDEELSNSDKRTALYIDIKKTKMRKQSSSGDDSTPLTGDTFVVGMPSLAGTPVIGTPSVVKTPMTGTPSVDGTSVIDTHLADYPDNSNASVFQFSKTTPEAEAESKVSIGGSSVLSSNDQCSHDTETKLTQVSHDLDIGTSICNEDSSSLTIYDSDLKTDRKQAVEEKLYCPRGLEKAESSPEGDCSTVREVLEFWLVMRFSDSHDALDVYFHRRDSDSSIPFTRAVGLVENVVNAIQEKCRIVNQRLLLQDLYETRICNPMLEPEADEDIWKHEDLRMSVSPLGVHISKGDGSGYRYVQGQYIYQPGHFHCDAVWRLPIAVHERLRDPSRRQGLSLGLNAIKKVLDAFRVSNRKHMFVYKETSGSVFYFKLFEGLCVSESSQFTQLEPRQRDLTEDEFGREDEIESSVASLAGSRYSSTWSLSIRGGAAELEEDIIESKLSKQMSLLDSEGGRSGRNASGPPSLHHVVQSVVLEVHGVDEPGPEITSQLFEVLQNRLDEATLEILTVLLSRNPKCKLTYADVWFIQPKNQDPSANLKFVIPPMDVSFLQPFNFYLTQNLLQFLTKPNYADPNPKHQFRPLCSSDKSESTEQTIYLYNRPQGSGGREGLACIAVSLLDSKCQSLQIQPGKIPALSVIRLEYDYLEECTEIYSYSDEIEMDGDYIVEFGIWERGDIGLKLLSESLKHAVRHALCEILIEFFLLPSSLSVVPTNLLMPCVYDTRQRSVSDPVSPSTVIPPLQQRKIYTGTQSDLDSSGFKRQLEVNLTRSFRSGTTSLGHRRTSLESPQRTPSSGSAPSKKSSRSSQSSPFLTNPAKALSFEDKEDVEVFKEEMENEGEATVLRACKQANEKEITDGDGNSEVANTCKDKRSDQEKQEQTGEVKERELQVKSEKGEEECPKENSQESDSSKSYQVIDVVQTYETLTEAEIQESQEFTSRPGTPLDESQISAAKREVLGGKATDGKIASREPSLTSLPSDFGSAAATRNTKSSELSSSLQPRSKGIELRQQLDDERKKTRIQYENGEKGELHPSFHGPAQDLFQFANVLGVPSVHCVEGQVLTCYAVDIVLLELVSLVNQLCPDMKPKIYRESPRSPDAAEDLNKSDSQFCKHSPVRIPLTVQREDESTADKPGCQCSPVPGTPSFFVLIGRNVNQWRASLGHTEDFSTEDSSKEDSTRHTKIQKRLQRFQPLAASTGFPAGQDNASDCSIPVGGVPRQRLIIVTVQQKEITVYTYNWAKDLNSSFDNQFRRLLHLNNARCHVTTCFIHQKMGLFHHSQFTDLNRNKKGSEINPYCLAANDMDMLMLFKQTSPSQLERERAVPKPLPSAVLVFDQVLRDVTPPRPLYLLPYSQHRDPVKRHGAHYQEIRSVQIKTSQLNSKLKELYETWQHRPPHPPTTEDKVEVLKRTSRLVHFCKAPLLFHHEWRCRLGKIPPIVASKGIMGDKTGDNGKKESSPAPPPEEEKWHQDLLTAYVQQYIQYMQSLQFVVVQTRPQSPKQSKSRSRQRFVYGKGRPEQSGGVQRKQGASNIQNRFCRYLQKTSVEGILLMQLSFQDCYFCVKLYALECSRIPSDKAVNSQPPTSKHFESSAPYKDFIHVLSFNYDFHLRNAQSFLGGRQMIFNKGYRVTDMLGELLTLYPKNPGFVCNHLQKGEVAIPCDPTVSSVKVFKYIEKNSSQYDFSTVKMKTLEGEKREAALLGTLSQSKSNEGRVFQSLLENNDYDITLLVTLKDKYEGGVLHLEYFVLMTSRRELFPKLTTDNRIRWRLSSGSSSSSKSKSIPESESIEAVQEKGVRVRFSLPRQTATDSESSILIKRLSSSGEFHRSASSPHSLYALGQDAFPYPPVLHAQSDENLYGKKISYSNSPKSGSPLMADSLQGKFQSREHKLLSDAAEKAHDRLLHVVCRAQTHCNRDLLWYRLLAVSEDERDAGEKAKRIRKKSEYRRPALDLAATWCGNGCAQSLLDDEELHTPHRLSSDELKYLMSVVHCTSLRRDDLVPLFSMNVSWYLGLIRVLMARFSDFCRSYTSEDSHVHYLAILNPSNLDMFVLVHVDETNEKADISTVFRELPREDEPRQSESQQHSRAVCDHLYNVINAVCFHSWTGILPS